MLCKHATSVSTSEKDTAQPDSRVLFQKYTSEASVLLIIKMTRFKMSGCQRSKMKFSSVENWTFYDDQIDLKFSEWYNFIQISRAVMPKITDFWRNLDSLNFDSQTFRHGFQQNYKI